MTAGEVLLGLFLLLSPSAPQPESSRPAIGALVELVEKGDPAVAEEALRRLLEEHEDGVVRNLLGVVLARQGRPDEAERELLRALRAEPDLAPAHRHLARLYLGQGRTQLALDSLRTAARLGELERDLGFELARLELEAGRPEAAEAELRSLIERFESVQAMLRLAGIARGRGDLDSALSLLERARRKAPNSEEVLNAQSVLSLEADRPRSALRVLLPLTRMYPTVSEYPFRLGVARMQLGDLSGAVEVLKQAAALDPDRARPRIALGMALNQLKHYREAESYLSEALLLAPGDLEAGVALAEAEAGLGELAASAARARRALAVDPDHAGAHLVLGTVLMKQQEYLAARDVLLRAVTADPASGRAHYQLSLAFARLGEDRLAEEHLERYRQARRDLQAEAEELYSDPVRVDERAPP